MSGCPIDPHIQDLIIYFRVDLNYDAGEIVSSKIKLGRVDI